MRIALRQVTVRFDEGLPSDTFALRGVELDINEGECVAIVGPTGSGKTTLLEVMAGLTRPTSGEVRVETDGEPLALRRCVGLAYQFPESQFFEETVFSDVAFGPRRQGVTEEGVRGRVEQALVRAGLAPEDFSERPPLSLSAGEKRRAAIAGILALERPFLLLDEPTAGLDPATAERLVDVAVNETRAGRGVVVVTHDLEFVDRVAGRTVVLSDGAVRADLPTSEAFLDGAMLDELGLAPPPRYALVDRLRRSGYEGVDRVAAVVLDASDG